MNTTHPPVSSAPSLNGVLRTVCMVLLAMWAVNSIYTFAYIPLFYQRAIAQTLPDIQVKGMLFATNASIEQESANRGLSIHDYVVYRIARDVLFSLVFYIMAFLILRSARGEGFVWFTALVLLFVPGGQLHFYAPLDQPFTRYIMPLSLLWPAFPLFLFLFPNGKAVPKWMVWLIGPILVLHLLGQGYAALATITGGQYNVLPAITPYLPFLFLSFPLALISQVYRYLRISTREERLQTKWVLGGFSLVTVVTVFLNALFHQTDPQADYGFSSDLTSMLLLLLPITIGISIMRYRLYDIDLLIRRGVVYGLLSALLSLVYFGSVIIFQQLFRGTSGQSSPLAVVISTLLIAALFTPLRSRLQLFIDRRFFRQRYDAANALEMFSHRLRNQVDLLAIAHDLSKVVADTIQPASFSLWIRKEEKK